MDPNSFLWSGGTDLSRIILNVMPLCHTTSELVSLISFANELELSENDELLLFFEKLKTYNYADLAVSIFFILYKPIIKKKCL